MKKAYVVLGMHRSGTSSVAGVLALLGAATPKNLMGPAEDNPKGFWESYAVSDLNDRILATGDSSWSDWRAFPEDLSAPFQDEGVRVLQSEFDDAETIVLKDPRICRLYSFWRDVLGQAGFSPIVICPLRHPVEVQASLTSRNGMAAADAIQLWLRHVLDAERFSRGQLRIFMRWSDFLADWPSQLARIEALESSDFALSDPQVAGRISDFLSHDLHHHRNSDDDASSSLDREVFATLSAMARDGETPVLLDQIDSQRRRFESV